MDHAFLVVASISVIMTSGGGFISNFSRYFILFLSFEAMRGYADNVAPYVNYDVPLAFDRFIGFGITPTEFLQLKLEFIAPAITGIAIFIYVLHFIVPYLFGLLLWLKRKEFYEPFLLCLITTSYLGLITFFIIPVAPPWLAAEKGMLDLSHLILEPGDNKTTEFIPIMYLFLNANPVAAFPSLHFAFPVLVAYFAVRAFGRNGLPFILYPLAMGFSIVYLGEHYVFDLLGGAIYAWTGIVASECILKADRNGGLALVYRCI